MDKIANIFLTLKDSGNLNKENMCDALSNIIDLSLIKESIYNTKNEKTMSSGMHR